uniref:Glycosyltransferase family 92 protein n=1 Tax=Strongyloides venezuelensis TaxID=75913 RepID=A0A0K0F143_STRVS
MRLNNKKFTALICLFFCSIYFVTRKYVNEVLLLKSNRIKSVNNIIENTNSTEDIKIPKNFTLWKPDNFNLECSRIINGDKNYINKIKKKRFTMKVIPKSYKYDCESINSRGFYSKVPLSDIEANYPIAYARNVYNNFHMLELQFLLSYAPQNHYCFAVDLKSTELYKQLTSLAKCFYNVYVPSKRYNMNSYGIYQAFSTYECMKILINKKWKYLFILQNDDFPLKTNREIVEILKARNNTLDMEFRDPSPFIQDRINQSASWDYKSLNFFNETEISKYDKNLLSENIKFSKGSYASGMPRDSVEFILNKINITKYLYQINTVNKFGEDEMVWQTLFSDNLLKIPHYVDRNCLSTIYNEVIFMVRNAIWEDRECKTYLCIRC